VPITSNQSECGVAPSVVRGFQADATFVLSGELFEVFD
jgi:hypothetical protein